MADITMCEGRNCPLKDKCYRHTAFENLFRQSYFSNEPYDDKKENCEYFWDDREYRKAFMTKVFEEKQITPRETFNSVVFNNMKKIPNYTPYCGNMLPKDSKDGCHNPRTIFSLKYNQFICPNCGWVSMHSDDVINDYKKFNSIK